MSQGGGNLVTKAENTVQKRCEELWLEHEPYIRKLCKYKLSSMPDAVDDCVQEVFYDLLESMLSGVEIERPRAWLTVVASNKIKDLYKTHSRESERIISFDSGVPEPHVEDNYDLESVTDEDLDKMKKNVMSKLSDLECSILEDYYHGGLKVKSLALKYGLSESNVKQMLFRARGKIRGYVKAGLKDRNL